MEDKTIKMIASELYNARETGSLVEQQVITSLTALEQAYQIQAAQIELYKEQIIGWKIGPTNKAKLVTYGIDEPLIAPVFESKCHGNNASFPIYMNHRPKLEAEIALRLHKNIDAVMVTGGRSAIREAVDAALPAVEVVSFRHQDPKSTALKVVADGGGNAGVVIGEKSLPFSTLSDLRIDVMVNGEIAATGSTTELLWDDVLDSVAWLAQHPVLQDRGLMAGDTIFTGACTSLVPVEPGQTASVNFEDFDNLTTTFIDANNP